MGCDIHSVIQGQWLFPEDGKTDETCWHTVSEGFHERDYQLFGILAGVRGPDEPIVQPRGLPADFKMLEYEHPIPADFMFRAVFRHPHGHEPWIYYMGEHSYTWYTLKELGKVKVGKQHPAIAEIARLMEDLAINYYEMRNWRIVIGFDS